MATSVETENLDGLIRKIHKEGLRRGREEADALVAAAREQAAAIIREAETAAAGEITAARERIHREERVFQAEARTAARDITMRLRENLIRILEKVMRRECADSLDADGLFQLISLLVRNRLERTGREQDFDVFLGKEHRDLLFNGFLNRLRDEVSSIGSLEIDERLSAGLRIGGAGDDLQFDISDAALAETLADYVLPRFADFFGVIAEE